MKVRTEVKTIEQEIKIYIAEDGKEFLNQKECIEYEIKLKQSKLEEKIKEFEIPNTDGFRPFNGQENYESHDWKWYRVENQEQLDILIDYYSDLVSVKQFPAIINVEMYDDDYCWLTTLDESIDYTTELCNRLGIKVKFEK